MGEMEDREYQRMSHAGFSYAFHKDAGDVPWVNLRWVRDVIQQVEAGGRSLRDIAGEPEQLTAVCRAVQAVDDATRWGVRVTGIGNREGAPVYPRALPDWILSIVPLMQRASWESADEAFAAIKEALQRATDPHLLAG